MARSIWQKQITDEQGNLQTDVQVTVRNQSDNELSTIYADQSGGAQLSNPFNTGASSLAKFFAEPGFYKVSVFKNGDTAEFQWNNLGDNRLREDIAESDSNVVIGGVGIKKRAIQVTTVAEAKAMNVPVDTIIETQGYYESGDGGANRYVVVAGGTGKNDNGSFIDMDNGNQAKGLFKYKQVSPEQFGAAGDGVSDDEDALQKCFDYVSFSGLNYKAKSGATYRVGQVVASGISSDLFFNGSSMYVDERYSETSDGFRIEDSENFSVDNISVNSGGGFEQGRSRLLTLLRCKKFTCKSIQAEYERQHLPPDNNESSPLWQLNSNSRCVRLNRCDDFIVGLVSVKKADVAVNIEDCFNARFGYFDINSYMKGVNIVGGEHVTIKDGWARGKTPSFKSHLRQKFNDWREDRPGNNAVLVGDENGLLYPVLKNLSINHFLAEDSGEHGFRFAGSNGDRGEWSLGVLKTQNTGAAGVKILGSDTTYLRNSTISEVHVTDARVGEETTLNSLDGATGFVFDSASNTITISGIEWPEYFGTEILTVTIAGSSFNDGSYTIDSRDSDTQITLSGGALKDETDSIPNSSFTWINEGKISHGLMLYNVRNVSVGMVKTYNKNQSHSCEDAIQLHDAGAVTIDYVDIINPKTNGISFRPSNGGTANDCTIVKVNGGVINGADNGAGINWNHDQIRLESIVMNNLLIINCGIAIRVYSSGSTPGVVVGDCSISATIDSAGTCYQSDRDTIQLSLKGQSDPVKSESARNGSIWQVRNDTLYLLKNGAWSPL